MSRAGPEPKTVPKWMPKGIPRGSQNDPKIALWGGPGAQVRRKGTPGVLRAPPEAQNGAKMEPKLH